MQQAFSVGGGGRAGLADDLGVGCDASVDGEADDRGEAGLGEQGAGVGAILSGAGPTRNLGLLVR